MSDATAAVPEEAVTPEPEPMDPIDAAIAAETEAQSDEDPAEDPAEEPVAAPDAEAAPEEPTPEETPAEEKEPAGESPIDRSWKVLQDKEAELRASQQAFAQSKKEFETEAERFKNLESAIRSHDEAMRSDPLGELERRYGWTLDHLLQNTQGKPLPAKQEPAASSKAEEDAVAKLRAEFEADRAQRTNAQVLKDYRDDVVRLIDPGHILSKYPGGIEAIMQKAYGHASRGVTLDPKPLVERVAGEFTESLRTMGVYDAIMQQLGADSGGAGAQADNGGGTSVKPQGSDQPQSTVTNGLDASPPPAARKDPSEMTREEIIDEALQAVAGAT